MQKIVVEEKEWKESMKKVPLHVLSHLNVKQRFNNK
jgi:hypothetical protein